MGHCIMQFERFDWLSGHGIFNGINLPVLRVVGRSATSTGGGCCCCWVQAVDLVRSLLSKLCCIRHSCLSRSGK